MSQARDASNFAVDPVIKGGTRNSPHKWMLFFGNIPVNGGFPIAMFLSSHGQATLTALHARGVSAVRMEAPVVLGSDRNQQSLDPNHPDESGSYSTLQKTNHAHVSLCVCASMYVSVQVCEYVST